MAGKAAARDVDHVRAHIASTALVDCHPHHVWSANPLGTSLPSPLPCYLPPEYIYILKAALFDSSCLAHIPMFSDGPLHTPTQHLFPWEPGKKEQRANEN
jgi:hypothetical protein